MFRALENLNTDSFINPMRLKFIVFDILVGAIVLGIILFKRRQNKKARDSWK